MTPSIANLVSVLDDLRSRTDQIRVDGLINLVRRISGSEMFNIDLLKDAYENNDTVKNMIRNIADDESGVKYVHLKSLDSDQEELPTSASGNNNFGSGRNPEQTVSSMAKRAARKRT